MERIKTLPDGRAMLNVGCGTHMHWGWNNIDFSWLGKLRKRMAFAGMLHRAGLLSDDRWSRLQKVDPDIIIHDLRKGIPFPDDSFDVVYHSHVLEHIDREYAVSLPRECRRVLKPGGVMRVVVPDMETIARAYCTTLDQLDGGCAEAEVERERLVNDLLEQMVRSEGAGTSAQRPLVRFVERMVRGDAGKSGELHRWMYDRYSLSNLLHAAGFERIVTQQADTSMVDGWNEFYLDVEPDGAVYKPESVYIEAEK